MLSEQEQRWSQWMFLAQAGDEQAYAKLLHELSAYITACLTKRFGNSNFIDDCVQESLLAIHTAMHTYDNGRPFKPWVNALVKYKTIDVLRKHKKNFESLHSMSSDEMFEFKEQANETEYTIDDHLMGVELLNRLPRIYLEPLVFTKMIGLSVEETAMQLNISQSAVKQRVKRAINKTMSLFKKESM